MTPPKKLEDLTLLETNAEIGVRREAMDQLQAELNILRQHRQTLSQAAPSETKPDE